ncbi:hypothetical protein [Streptomyces thermolineatus]
MRTVLGVWAVAAAAVLVAGCSGGGEDVDPGPSRSSSPSGSAGSGLAAEWEPKLRKAADGGTRACADVASDGCAQYLGGITETAYDLRDAIVEAGAEDAYPRTMAEIEKVTTAADSYVEDGCEEAAEPGCSGHAALVRSGGSGLRLMLAADEAGGQG